MATDMNKDAMLEVYNDVRQDSTETTWALFTYDGNAVDVGGQGVAYEELVERLTEDQSGFGYARFTVGDEMSQRPKFVLITWIGAGVPPMRKARMGALKSDLKTIIKECSVEIQASELEDVEEKNVRDLLTKAGGANYGTGVRD